MSSDMLDSAFAELASHDFSIDTDSNVDSDVQDER